MPATPTARSFARLVLPAWPTGLPGVDLFAKVGVEDCNQDFPG